MLPFRQNIYYIGIITALVSNIPFDFGSFCLIEVPDFLILSSPIDERQQME
jgi:hypothetical protein